jgi:hypothetical protein
VKVVNPETTPQITQPPQKAISSIAVTGVLSLDSEFDFSKNEPLKKQNTIAHDVDDFFDFAKQPDPSSVQRS